MKKIIIIQIIFILSTFNFFGQDSFIVKCLVKNDNKSSLPVVVKIYKYGKLISETESKKGKIEINLPYNNEYLVEFCSDDYYTKRIAFNTKMETNEIKTPILDLSIQLVDKKNPMMLAKDIDLLDFPVSYIAFDKKKYTFYDLNKDYTRVINQIMEKSTREFYNRSENIANNK